MYGVNGKRFSSFMQARRAASAANAEVMLLDEDGRVVRSVWHPAPPPSAKRMRRYRQQKAAYEAQQRLLGLGPVIPPPEDDA